jgi:hypothetical protein
VNYIGYTPYELKWPQNTIVITKILNETDNRDPVTYIQKAEVIKWLNWNLMRMLEERMPQDNNCKILYKELTGNDVPIHDVKDVTRHTYN